MSNLDPERERQRFAQFYGSQSDEELLKIAQDAASLRDEARDALGEELLRRGLSPDSAQTAEVLTGHDELESRELVILRRFRDLPAALLAKGMLDSAGIECHLADDNMVRLDWFISNLLGGIKLLVTEADADEANRVLEEPIPAGFEVEGVGEYQQPRCPTCGSLDIVFEALNKQVAFTTASLLVPIPLQRNEWKCEACGARWHDQDESKEEQGN